MSTTRRTLALGLLAALLAALLIALSPLVSTTHPAPAAASHAATPPAPTPIRVNPALSDAPNALTSDTPLILVTSVLEPPSDKLLADTLAALKRAADNFHSIHVYGTYAEEVCDPLRHTWREEGSIEGDGVYEFATSRQRYHASSDLAAWNPTGKPIHEQFDETFDGKTDQQSPHRYFIGSYEGPPIAMPQSTVAIIGQPFAFPFYPGNMVAFDTHATTHPFYSEIPLASATARRVILNDSQPAIELRYQHQSGPNLNTITLYVDSEHGDALIASLNRSDNGRSAVWYQTAVYALLPAAPGIYYPQHAALIYGTNYSPHARGTFTACSAIANEPHPDSFFTLPPAPQ